MLRPRLRLGYTIRGRAALGEQHGSRWSLSTRLGLIAHGAAVACMIVVLVKHGDVSLMGAYVADPNADPAVGLFNIAPWVAVACALVIAGMVCLMRDTHQEADRGRTSRRLAIAASGGAIICMVVALVRWEHADITLFGAIERAAPLNEPNIVPWLIAAILLAVVGAGLPVLGGRTPKRAQDTT